MWLVNFMPDLCARTLGNGDTLGHPLKEDLGRLGDPRPQPLYK
jgi:hypothetical protein